MPRQKNSTICMVCSALPVPSLKDSQISLAAMRQPPVSELLAAKRADKEVKRVQSSLRSPAKRVRFGYHLFHLPNLPTWGGMCSGSPGCEWGVSSAPLALEIVYRKAAMYSRAIHLFGTIFGTPLLYNFQVLILDMGKKKRPPLPRASSVGREPGNL